MDQPIEEPQQPMVHPDIDDLEPLYSDHEEVLPETAPSLVPSPSGTSAPLLSNPALTDTLSNFPLFSSRAASSVGLELAEEVEPQEGTDREIQEPSKVWKHYPHREESQTEEEDQEADLKVVEEEVPLHQVKPLQELADHIPDQEAE